MDNVDKLQLIKETLEKKGVSQTKLAELLGVNLTTVNNWFRRGSIPQKYMDNIAMLFNLNIGVSEPTDSTYKESLEMDTVFSSGFVQINHIDSYKKIKFNIDKSVIGVKELDKLRFNLYQSKSKYVDIIDISVDNYCGDGIYYLKYPHGLLAKRIKYNLNNTYTVIDCNDNTSRLEVLDFSGKLAGKVIARVEIFN
ncbi:MAG: helix-turn-helix transcriptional regulator [Campylobacterales bacterium]|nr:helix-turn-helix transcriptional regulator [Campylobacterales bacterium]